MAISPKAEAFDLLMYPCCQSFTHFKPLRAVVKLLQIVFTFEPTGARAGEITQLRKEDLTVVSGTPKLTITPEAGSVKAGMYREVPVHPHLQEVGLIDFIGSAKSGYLFHTGPPWLRL
ncbi:hypothetical protein [Pseudophaeobacter sp.]|uniref:hypothetical protein n=1 Tax=Pseudophaeobacter sp. TaxID=1971739 RepID=UPI00329A19C9